jgi:hypothetical protein
MNFSVNQALQLGRSRQGGINSTIPSFNDLETKLMVSRNAGDVLLQRAKSTQTRMNTKALRDLSRVQKDSLYALVDDEDDVRVTANFSDMQARLIESNREGFRDTFRPQVSLDDVSSSTFNTSTINAAVDRGKRRAAGEKTLGAGLTERRVQIPGVSGTSKLYELPSGHTLIKIVTEAENKSELDAINTSAYFDELGI